MKTALIIGGLGLALAVGARAMRSLRRWKGSRMTDHEYFTAARRRAIKHRTAANGHQAKTAGDE